MAATIAAYERRKRRKLMKQGRLKWDSGYHYFLLLFSCSVRPEWSWTNLSAKFSSAETLWPFWTFLFSALDKGNNNISAKNQQEPKQTKQIHFSFRQIFPQRRKNLPSDLLQAMQQGTLTLILKGKVSVRLTSSSLLVWTRLFWKWKQNSKLVLKQLIPNQ